MSDSSFGIREAVEKPRAREQARIHASEKDVRLARPEKLESPCMCHCDGRFADNDFHFELFFCFLLTAPVLRICYKNSTDDGATWSNLTDLAAEGRNPTVVCDKHTNTVILQFNVRVFCSTYLRQDPLGSPPVTENGGPVHPSQAKFIQDAHANWNVFPLMLLASSVNTPNDNNRSHLLALHVLCASCVN